MTTYIGNIKSFVTGLLTKATFLGLKSNTTQKTDKNIIINQLDVRPILRKSQDIESWRNALQRAESIYQQRATLYDLYADIVLDGFLISIMEKRTYAITNSKLVFRIKEKEIEEVNTLTNYSFFQTLLKEIVNSKFYGHSLLELNWNKDNPELSTTNLINRKHVKPKLGIVTKNAFDVEGVAYRKPPFAENLIEVGDNESLGALLEASPYVIYKRGAFGDWAEFAEIFGIPFRWATYQNEQNREVLKEALAAAGSAGYVVAPKDAELQFISADTKNGTDVFDRLRQACNEELSIRILGNTMTTTEAKHSGYAQSKTHQDEQFELHKEDRQFLLRILNERLTPYLTKLGYRTKNGVWDFVDDDKLSLTDRLNIDLKVADKVPIGASYWYEKYKIPKPSQDELVEIEEAKSATLEKEEIKPKKGKKP